MTGGKPIPDATRKSVTLPNDLWRAVADYRFSRRVPSEAEAVRRLIEAGLKAERERKDG